MDAGSSASGSTTALSSAHFGPYSQDHAAVLAALEEWRKDPTSEALNKRVQQLCLEFILSQEDHHWFCSRTGKIDANLEGEDGSTQAPDVAADQPSGSSSSSSAKARGRKDALREVAIFCVRLVGYKPAGKVQEWKSALERLLLHCTGCVRGWGEAQRKVGDLYLRRRWNEDTVKNWYASLKAKEVQRVKDTLALYESRSTSSSNGTPPSLPTPLTYNILLDHRLYTNKQVLESFSKHLESVKSQAPIWQDPAAFPAGLIYLLFYGDAISRTWATSVLQGPRTQITLQRWEDKDSGVARDVLEVLETLTRRDRMARNTKSAFIDLSEDDAPLLTDSASAIWSGMSIVTGLLPTSVFVQYLSGGGDKMDIVRLICGHLGDKGDHWIEVLRTFRNLLDKMDDAMWRNVLDRKGKGRAVDLDADDDNDANRADLGYAGARLYDALDNDQFAKHLSDLATGDAERRSSLKDALFGWLFPLLKSLRSFHVFGPCLSAIFTKLLDDIAQKTRFDNAIRSTSVEAALEVLCRIFESPSIEAATTVPKDGWIYLDQVVKVVERHVQIITKVAFDRQYTSDEAYAGATRSAQRLVSILSRRDAKAIRAYVYMLADERRRTRSKDSGTDASQLTSLTTCGLLVAESFQQFQKQISVRGIAMFAQALSISSHVTRLSSRTWVTSDSQRNNKVLRNGMRLANEAIEKLHSPAAKMIRLLANEDSPLIKDALRIPSTATAVTMLIISPNESIANAAQSMVRQAFDVSSRADCFRCLIQFIPEEALDGIIQSLRTFKEAAVRLPEACEQAKRLVRCLTDCISVMCDTTDRTIRDERWVEKHNAAPLVSKIWNLMSADIAIIFERTEHWAVAFENEQMTEWMRDALIFLDEMLDEIRAFEAAATGMASSAAEPSPRKISSRGREMIESLNEPLVKLQAWLRLNDKDLLEQTVKVVVKLIERFAKSKVPLSAEVVKRLQRMADKYQDPKTRKDLTLRPEELLALFGALSRHPDHEKQFSEIIVSSGGKRLSNRDQPIDLEDDSSDSDDVEMLSETKKSAKPAVHRTTQPINGTKSYPLPASKTVSSRAGAPRPLATSAQGNGPQFRVAKTTLGTSNKVRTAPTKMKNVLYSHSAMRAARDRSSSDDEEYTTSNRPSGLARLAEGQKPKMPMHQPPQAPQPTVQRKTKLLELHQPGQQAGRRGNKIMTAAQQQLQNQQKARMRYNPDYTDLHRQILQWNATATGSVPPGGFRFPRTIPTHFDNSTHYIDTFLPLLLLECWNEVVSAREEIMEGTAESEPLAGRLAGRASVDDFLELFVSIDRLPDRTTYTEQDIILMRGPCQTLGKIHQIMRKQQKIDITIRVHIGRDDGSVSRALVMGTHWSIHKLFSLSTAHREYGALMSMPYYDLVDEILSPPHHKKPEMPEALINRAMSAYRVNRPQAGAILSALSRDGFSLIQGPPGTGKTKTILGLVGAFISDRGRRARAGGHSNGYPPPSEKLLLCAPSNAAVDEVAKRLKEGVFDSEGKRFVPKVVRIGAEYSINVSVSEVFLDNLVEKALAKENGQSTAAESASLMSSMRTEMSKYRAEREEKRTEKNNMVNNTSMVVQLSMEITSLTQKIDDLAERLDRERDRMTQANRASDAARKRIRAEILADADVICSTLSGSGHEYLANYDFETVIIDEAAQSVEISSLIPLKYNCQRCIMVGDPNQLPPTVKSREATNVGYNRSLFVRIHEIAPEATHLLSIQYRMHPDISSFPSKAFYESRLADGPDMATTTKQPWHEQGETYPAYAFLHVKGGREEQGKHHSLYNREEAAVAVALYDRLRRDCPQIDLDFRVGIITPYKGQLGELKKQFRRRFGDEILSKVDFNTVDGFQGQEKDIIILSCVRGGQSDGTGIGFLSDVRRMNVALTRARSSLFILGDSRALKINEHWRKLVTDAEERGCLREVDTNSFSITPSTSKGKLPAPTPPKRISSATAAKAKACTHDTSKQILRAPAGLMTPSDMAKSTTEGLGSGDSRDAKIGVGIKRRLLGSIKKEEEEDGGSVGQAANPSNGKHTRHLPSKPSFLNNIVKTEELEEGEISSSTSAMDGVEYTSRPTKPPAPSATTNGQRPGPSLTSDTSTSTSTKTSAAPASTSTSGVAQAGGDGTPVTSNVKKRPAGSMFIPRKKPNAVTK